ncbi:MAG: DUF4440 domain-containing protein [Longimicrobiaceae bacterium]
MKRLLCLTVLLVAATAADAQKMPVTTTSDAARAQYVQGVDALTNADFATARVHLDSALAADPSFAMAHMYRAVAGPAAVREEHMRQASALGARASEAERQEIESYAANLRDDHDREIALLTSLAERFPGDPLPMFIVANTEANRDQPAAAVAAARRALVADPSFAPAYNVIGYAEMAQKHPAEAEQAFRDYIRLAPDHANPYDSYGEFLMNQGRLDEAERHFEMALTRDPEFTVSHDNLTRIAIMRAYGAHHAAINSQDAAAAAATYTATVVMSPPDGSQIVGREAVQKLLDGYYDAGRVTVEGETQEIQPMGDDFAYQRTALTARIDGAVAEQGINSYIWVKTPDGWKIARDTWTSKPQAVARR